MNPKILITGAAGHLGKAVVNHLISKMPASEVAVMVRDEAKADDLKAIGVEVRKGDYSDPASLTSAMKGIERVLLISSSDLSGRFAQHKNVIDAAKQSGVKHIYYTGISMNNATTSPMKSFMNDHFLTEDYIKQQGIVYTLLRNGLYTDVIPMFVGSNVLETGIFFASGAGKVAFAARQDLAEATANIIASAGHENKVYELSGNKAYSFGEVGEHLSQISGKQVAFTSPDDATFTAALRQYGLPEPIVNMSAGFAAAIRNNDFDNTNDTLEKLLERKPTDITSFLKQVYSAN